MDTAESKCLIKCAMRKMNSFLIKQLSICDWKRNEKGMAWKEGSGDCEQWIRLEEREYRNKRGGFCFKYVYFIRNCHRNGRYPLMVLIAKPNLSYCAYLLLQFWFQICNYGPNFSPMQRLIHISNELIHIWNCLVFYSDKYDWCFFQL